MDSGREGTLALVQVLPRFRATVHRVGVPSGATRLKQAESLAAQARWPTLVGGVSSPSPDAHVLCVGPAEWLATGFDPASALSSAPLAAVPFVAVDITDATAQISLSGPAVEDLLASVCALDVHASAFPVGSCARCRLGGVAVVLHRRAVNEIGCYVPRSFERYLLSLLDDASRDVMSTGYIEQVAQASP
jgi:heterotetrameric sarcosine oxidase gamma subunit